MMLRSALAMVLVLGACTGSQSPDTSAEEQPTAKGSRGQRMLRSFVMDDRYCVPERWTLELPPERQTPVSDPVGSCGNYVSGKAIEANPIPCGPCGFVLDSEVTRSARATARDACCYRVSSPEPPQPPTPDSDPRYACTKNGDCVASCRHGAVSSAWHQATYPDGESCKDGCTSKGTDPPMCMNGSCIARRLGKDDPACTRLDVEPLPSPTAALTPTSGAPLTIEARRGFVLVEESSEAGSGHLRFSSPPGSGCMVDARWWRPMPPDPGGPMVVASRRAITVGGTATEVVTTSMFEGREQKVDAVFLSGDAYQIRIVFESCGALEEDGFLEGVRVGG